MGENAAQGAAAPYALTQRKESGFPSTRSIINNALDY